MNNDELQDDTSRNTPRPGRPRSVATQGAVLAAALRLTERTGYSRLTVEGIAAEAGVGKQTVYRWWPSKAAVVLEAFTRDARASVNVKITGDLRVDLAAFLTAVYKRLSGPSGTVVRSLLAEALSDSEFAQALSREYLSGRIDDLKAVLNGRELAPGMVDQVIEMTYGAIWYRLVTRQPLTPAVARRLADAVTTLVGQIEDHK